MADAQTARRLKPMHVALRCAYPDLARFRQAERAYGCGGRVGKLCQRAGGGGALSGQIVDQPHVCLVVHLNVKYFVDDCGVKLGERSQSRIENKDALVGPRPDVAVPIDGKRPNEITTQPIGSGRVVMEGLEGIAVKPG